MGRKRKYKRDSPNQHRAVQVMTIQSESSTLVVENVPAINVSTELEHRFAYFGGILSVDQLKDYLVEPFTEAYVIKYAQVSCAREARQKMKDASFYGSLLQVRYAPEHESVTEKRLKMMSRMREISLQKQ